MAAKRVRTARPKLEDLVATYPGVQLATLSEELPRSGAWSYELKYDGYRILAMKVGKAVRLISRCLGTTGQTSSRPSRRASPRPSTSDRVSSTARCARSTRPASHPFQLLQNRARGVRVVYFVFDVLFDGEDVRGLPIEQRRERLASVVSSRSKESAIALSSPSDKDGASVFQAACAAGMEGVVAKQVGSPYVAGRSKAWLKIKCTPPAGVRDRRLAAARGLTNRRRRAAPRRDGGGRSVPLRRQGRHRLRQQDAGVALHHAARRRDEDPDRGGRPEVRTPGALRRAEARRGGRVHGVWTEAGHVRHPSFQGLRADKRPEECVREGSQ